MIRTKKTTTSVLSAMALAVALGLGGSSVAAAQSSPIGETSVDSGIPGASNNGIAPTADTPATGTSDLASYVQSGTVAKTSVDSATAGGSNHGMTPNADTHARAANPAPQYAQSDAIGDSSVDSGTLDGSNHGMTPSAGALRAPAHNQDYAMSTDGNPKADMHR